MEGTSKREYPILPLATARPERPISFVVVHFSDDFFHNLDKSDCVHDGFNELVVVDNRGNVFFDNLSSALLEGINRSKHDLVAIVHEDVLLLPGWQARFEHSLAELEHYDPEWGVLGAVGWSFDGRMMGHWSDPSKYSNLFTGQPFAEVKRIDEQIMVLRKSRGIYLDSKLPSIHRLGWDLALSARKNGRKAYVIDAPTIHKYADAEGLVIQTSSDSPKILGRKSFTWRADKECCDDYFFHKWREEDAAYQPVAEKGAELAPSALPRFAEPIILLSRGGGGSRLLSVLGRDAGVHLGTDLNPAGDSLDMVIPVYKSVIEKYQCKADWQQAMVINELRIGAYRMLERAGFPERWGFKLPESLLLVPEIAAAFPRARFVHMVRDPVATCLRRTHMTARLDNQIGQVSLPLAYRYHGLPAARILEDSPALHMAYTTMHQLEITLEFCRSLPADRYFELRFEDLLRNPHKEHRRFGRWLERGLVCRVKTEFVLRWRQLTGQHGALEQAVDPDRASKSKSQYPPDVEVRVRDLLANLRKRLGYPGPG